ncbi:MAG: hypothetical protein MJ009_02905 [Paludibacteraceae bacterium]|nr:hypothetical protein [Paludibacteraceae bacterium]
MRKRIFTLTVMFVSTGLLFSAFADDGTLTTEQEVCQSTKYEYTIDSPESGASYEFKLFGGTDGTDYVKTDDTNKTTIEWKTSNLTGWSLKSRETSADGCVGPWKETTVKVSPKPKYTPTSATLCSDDSRTEAADDTYNTALPTKDDNNVTLVKWDIAIKGGSLPSGVTSDGATIPATGVTSADYLKSLHFENTNTTSQTVELEITPYSASCAGEKYTQQIIVLPKVNEPTVKFKSL